MAIIDKKDNMDHKKYCGTHGNDYKRSGREGSTCINVLQNLHGKKWDAISLSFVSGLRPSKIRVTNDMVTLDFVDWRVTVFVDNENIIKSIEQEVVVMLPSGVENYHSLEIANKYGIESEKFLSCEYQNTLVQRELVDTIREMVNKNDPKTK